MTEERKIGIGIDVNSQDAEASLQRVGEAASKMAQAVGQSGQEASKGVEAIGAAADKLTAQQQRLVDSIKRTAILTTEGKAAYLEQKAALLGVSDATAGYIAKIRGAEQDTLKNSHAMEGFGFATAGAKRELLVLTHELSQGNFSRFGSSLLVLAQRTGAASVLFSGAAAAAGVLVGGIAAVAVAAAKGAGELKAFQEATTITGNAVGVSASQFASLRDSIAGIATKGKAAAVLTEIAGSGKIAGDAVKGIAEAAILMEKATGQATAKTIEQFAELAKTPTESVAKLNEQYNFLTTSTYRQIKALEDQGKTLQAANLAENTYADALKARSQTIIDNAGLIEKAWRGVTGTVKGAWDAMLGIGRDLSPSEQLAKAAADVARIQAQLASAGSVKFSTTAGGAAVGAANPVRQATLEKELEIAKETLLTAQRRAEIEARNTSDKAEQNRLSQLGIAFVKQGDEFLTKQDRMQRELLKARTEGQELVNSGIITETELTKRLADIRDKYKDTSAVKGESQLAAVQARIEALKAFNDALRQQIQSGVFDESAKPTEAAVRASAVQKELAGSISGVTRALKEKELVALQALAVEEKSNAQLERQKTALKESQAATLQQIDAVQKQADAIRDQAIQQESVNANFGKTKTAVEEATLAQLNLQLAEAQESSQFAPAYVAALALKTDAQRRFVTALQQTEFKQASLKLNDAAAVARETTDTLQLEVSLLGATQVEREKVLAQRQIEIKLAKELQEIDRLNLGTGPEAEAKREELRAKAAATAVVEANNASAKIVLAEWQRTADSLNSSLTDAFIKSIDAGKGLFRNLRDAIKQSFENLVLRPVISAVMSPISGAITNLIQPITSGITSAISSSLGLPGIASALGIGGSSAALTGFNTAIGTAVTGDFASAAAAASAAGAAGTAGLGGISAAMAAIPGWGWAALGAAAVVAFMSKGGGPKTDGAFGFQTPGGMGAQQIAMGDNAAGLTLKPTIDALQASFDAMAKQFGITAAFQFGASISSDPKGTAPSFVEASVGKNGTSIFNSLNLNVGRSEAELQAATAEALSRAMLAALKNSDLSGKIADYFSSLDPLQLSADQINSAVSAASTASQLFKTFDAMGPAMARLGDISVAAANALADASGGLAALQQNLSTYYQNFYSASEQASLQTAALSKTLGDLGLSLPTTREGFRALVEAQDLSTEAGQKNFAALVQVAGAFASVVAPTDALTVSLRSAADIASERANLEKQLLQAQGNTAALRAQELAGLDASNRALQLSIYAIEDQAAAAEKLKAAQDAVIAATQRQADAEKSLASARNANIQALQALQQFGDAIRTNITSTQDAINQLRGQAQQARDAAISTNESALQQLASYAATLKQQIDSVSQSINQLRLAAQQEVLTAEAAVVASAKALQAEKDRTATALEQAQATQAAAQQSVQNAMQSLGSYATQLQGSIDSVGLSINALRQQAAQLVITLQDAVRAAAAALVAEQDRTAAVLKSAQASEAAAQQAVINAITGVSGVIDQSKSELDAAKQRLADLQKTSADALRQIADSIDQFLRQISGSGIGSNSPAGQAAFNLATFAALVAKALTGDTTAGGQVVGAAQTALESARTTSTTKAAFLAEETRIRLLLSQVSALAPPVDPLQQAANDLAAATAAVTAAQQKYDDFLARAAASGIDLTLANTADALDQAIATYTNAQNDLAAAQAATAQAQTDATAAAAAVASALATANTLGLQIPATVSQLQGLLDTFNKATTDLARARADAIAVEADKATADASIVAKYQQLTAQLASLVAEQGTLTQGAAAFGIDLSTLGAAATGAESALSAYSQAQQALNNAQASSAQALADSSAAAAAFLDAVSQAAALGVALPESVTGLQELVNNFGTALDGLTTARANAISIEADKATADAGIVAQYQALATQLDDLLGEQSSLFTGANNLGVNLDALAVTTTNAQSVLDALAASQTALSQANADYAAVDGDLYEAGKSLITQYGALNTQLDGYTSELEAFQTRTAAIDFSALLHLDPLGDLLTQFSDSQAAMAAAVKEVADAAIALAAARAAETAANQAAADAAQQSIDMSIAQQLANQYVSSITSDPAAWAAAGRAMDAPGGATADQINALYNQYLGRNAEAGLASAWAGYIDGGSMSLADVISYISTSPEAIARSYGENVQKYFDYLVNASLNNGITQAMTDSLFLSSSNTTTPVTTTGSGGYVVGSSGTNYTTPVDLLDGIRELCLLMQDANRQGLQELSNTGKMANILYNVGRTGAITVRADADEPLLTVLQ